MRKNIDEQTKNIRPQERLARAHWLVHAVLVSAILRDDVSP
jgi:hypothetical protein